MEDKLGDSHILFDMKFYNIGIKEHDFDFSAIVVIDEPGDNVDAFLCQSRSRHNFGTNHDIARRVGHFDRDSHLDLHRHLGALPHRARLDGAV